MTHKTNRDSTRAYTTAKAALRDNQQAEIAAGITHETDEYLRLNAKVNELAKEVSWWRR